MKEQRNSANEGNAAALLRHIQDCQDMATDISSLIESAAVLDNDGTFSSGVTTLLKLSGELANKLTSNLDSVNLPEVQA